MAAFTSGAVYNSIASAFGLVMIGHALASGQPAASIWIWYSVVIVFGASTWALSRAPARWIARVAIALNAMLGFLVAVTLASLVSLRDELGLSATAMAPRILVAIAGLVLVTANIRWLLRRWHMDSPRSEGS